MRETIEDLTVSARTGILSANTMVFQICNETEINLELDKTVERILTLSKI